MNTHLVYVTAGSEDEARRIGKIMVGERLAACANISGPITSIYWWQGELCEEGEAALILKTREELIAPLTQRIKQVHGYDCPCVVAVEIHGGNREFLDWIVSETS